jgi:hypothetical protein
MKCNRLGVLLVYIHFTISTNTTHYIGQYPLIHTLVSFHVLSACRSSYTRPVYYNMLSPVHFTHLTSMIIMSHTTGGAGRIGSSIVCSETVYLTRVIVIPSYTSVASVRCEFLSRVLSSH